jgi:hypothetical protein
MIPGFATPKEDVDDEVVRLRMDEAVAEAETAVYIMRLAAFR